MRTVTIRQAAEVYGVSVDTIRRRIHEGKLKSALDIRGWHMVEVPDGNETSTKIPSRRLHNAPALAGAERVEIVELRHQRDQLERQVSGLSAHVDALMAQLTEAAKERLELRQLLAKAQEQLDTLLMPQEDQVENPLDASDGRPWWRRRRRREN